MNFLTKTFSAILLIVICSGCASIVSKSNWPLTVISTPSGAKVEITNIDGELAYSGTTPATMKLKSGAGYFSKQSYKVKLTMDGFGEKIIPVECKLNGWYIGNLVFGGLIGFLIVDPLTGAMYQLDAKVIHETFSDKISGSEPRLEILDINDLNEGLRKHLVAIEYNK